MLMVVGELKELAADLRNAILSFNNHLVSYKEDKKDHEKRISGLEQKMEHLLGKAAGIAIAAAIGGAGLTLFFECHMGYCK